MGALMTGAAHNAASMPRVLFVLSQRDYASNGGVASVTELLRRLQGVDKHVWTSHAGKLADSLRAHVSAVEVRPEVAAGGSLVRRVRSALRSNFDAWRTVRHGGFDAVVDVHRVAFWRTALGAKLAGAAVIDNLRDTQPRLRRLRSLKWALEFLLADAVIVLSDDMKRRWQQVLPIRTRDWLAIYSAVDFERFRPLDAAARERARAGRGIAPGELALAYVGAFREKKQQLALIERLLPALAARLPEARLHFLGDFDPQRDAYAAACRDAVQRLGLERACVFHGHQDAVETWYAAADLTVLASAQEGLARSMIESLACGTPVASFDVASAAEILAVHEVGRVAPLDDYPALLDAIAECVRAPARDAVRARAAHTARRLFAAEESAARYAAVYRSLRRA